MTDKTVRDAFATLNPRPSETHPFVVHLRFTDGTTSEDIDCRTLRDCLICGNGMTIALMAINALPRTANVNVVFDPCFER